MGIKHQIIVEIDEDDNITLETKGIKGPDCIKQLEKVTKDVATIKSTKKTKEYYEAVKSKIKKTINRFSK